MFFLVISNDDHGVFLLLHNLYFCTLFILLLTKK